MNLSKQYFAYRGHRKRFLPLLLLPLAMTWPSGAQTTSPGSPSARFARATGTASVAVKPDQAEIDIGVLSEADTAQGAAAANASDTAKVLDQLKKAGGPSAEIRTQNYSVHPRYRHDQPGREPAIVGFTASNILHVKVKDIEKVGALIDAATQNGANQIHGIQFTVRDEQAARAGALRQATQNAIAGAGAMAAAAGAKPGKVLSVEEQGSAPIQPLRTMAMAEARATPTPVEPGTVEIAASVTVTVEIQ
jgi:uncharacterized protein YggE